MEGVPLSGLSKDASGDDGCSKDAALALDDEVGGDEEDEEDSSGDDGDDDDDGWGGIGVGQMTSCSATSAGG